MKDMWKNVPWIEVYDGGLKALDPTHPHHLKDVLKVDGTEAAFLEMFGMERVLPGKWLVGCADKGQFFHWFPPTSLDDFAHYGLLLSIYEVDPDYIKMGKYQLMFELDKAKLVKREPLIQLEKAA
jgi:hypothetical protein